MNTKLLSYFAIISIVATVLGIAFSALELSLFAVAVSALVMLIAALDYAPRPCYSQIYCRAQRPNERFPLAG